MARWRARVGFRAGRALLLALALGAPSAFADRTSHLFVDETQILPEGDVELENWVWSQGQIPSTPGLPVTTWIWFGPTVGISPHLEMSLPLVVVGYPEKVYLDSISLVARYRLFPREQEEGLQPLLRVEYQQPLSSYLGPPELKVLLVATYGSPKGVQGTLNVGVQFGLPKLVASSSEHFFALGTAAVGVSVPVGQEFRLAAELDGQLPLAYTRVEYPYPYPYPNLAQLFLGPSVAWTRGQIWVTFGTLFGLTNNSNRFLPKVLWGITF